MTGLRLLLLSLCALLAASGCRTNAGDEDTGADTDSDTDSDVDTDTGTGPATECDSCPEGQTCLSWVRGRVLYEDGTPVTGVEHVVKFHIKVCHYTETDENGYFEIFKGCFIVDEPFFLEMPSLPAFDDSRSRYAVEFFPTREQIMDQGEDDYVFDIGDVYWWDKPEPTASYTAAAGTAVDEAGVQFDVPPGALGEEDLELGVFQFPLEQWVPPFIANPYSEFTVDHADALYVLSPYWQEVVSGDGVVLRIDPPEGWTAEDTGKVYVLGDWVWYFLELPELGEIDIGQVVELGSATWDEGKIVTPPLPRLSWVILVKD